MGMGIFLERNPDILGADICAGIYPNRSVDIDLNMFSHILNTIRKQVVALFPVLISVFVSGSITRIIITCLCEVYTGVYTRDKSNC